MEHFSKTAPPKRKLSLGINDGPGAKKAKESGTEDSESDSSSGEDDKDISVDSNKNEVEVSFGVFTSQGGKNEYWTRKIVTYFVLLTCLTFR